MLLSSSHRDALPLGGEEGAEAEHGDDDEQAEEYAQDVGADVDEEANLEAGAEVVGHLAILTQRTEKQAVCGKYTPCTPGCI